MAVALQLLLSFAHIHIPADTPAQLTTQGAPTGEPTDAPLMAHDCAVCSNIAAFQGIDLPVTFILAVTIGWIMCLRPMTQSRLIRHVDYPFFRTRAPPVF